MSEPTTYDLVQDTRIKGVEDLVQTTYQPIQGPEFSYPVVHQPMDDEMWQSVTLGVGSGVLDTGGHPYWLRDLSDVTDTGKLTVDTTTGTAQAILRGFYHRLTQDMTLNFPPVSQKTTYHVVLEYDPLRHKEPSGPIRVRVLTSLDSSGGKHYLTLYRVTRTPSQLLTQATVERVRPRVAPTIYVWDETHKPDPEKQLWGTMCFVGKTGSIYRATDAADAGEEGEGRAWASVTDPDWVEYGDTPTYVWAGEGHRRAIKRRGKSRWLRGSIRSRDGNIFRASSTGGYLLFSLAEGDRPSQVCRGIVAANGTNPGKYASIVIYTNGEVRAFPGHDSTYLTLDGITWDVD